MELTKNGRMSGHHCVVNRITMIASGADEELNYIFRGFDLQQQLRSHQALFISYALGGPEKFKGKTLRYSHTGLNISNEQYEKTIHHLNEALREAGVPLEDRTKVEAFIRSVKPHIINR